MPEIIQRREGYFSSRLNPSNSRGLDSWILRSQRIKTKLQKVENLILLIRGQKVMLDFHLAELYGVETKVLNQAVKRNIQRFPSDFMFHLSNDEWTNLKSQIVTSNNRSQIVTGSQKHRSANPYAFTEQGVAMLSSVLRSKRAIEVNITIMRTFVKMRMFLDENVELKAKIEDLEAKYDKQFAVVFQAIKSLIEKPKPERKPIGFKTK